MAIPCLTPGFVPKYCSRFSLYHIERITWLEERRVFLSCAMPLLTSGLQCLENKIAIVLVAVTFLAFQKIYNAEAIRNPTALRLCRPTVWGSNDSRREEGERHKHIPRLMYLPWKQPSPDCITCKLLQANLIVRYLLFMVDATKFGVANLAEGGRTSCGQERHGKGYKGSPGSSR